MGRFIGRLTVGFVLFVLLAGCDRVGLAPAAPPRVAAAEKAPPAAKGGYYASSKSAVFHRPECSYVEKIAAKNLVHFDTREDAIKAGKRPCEKCEP